MNDNGDLPEEEPRFDERGIAQVGSANRQTNILVVVFGVAIVGAKEKTRSKLIVFSMTTSCYDLGNIS